jgi:hypothetical protein
MRLLKNLSPFIVPIIFLIVGILTLSDYGFNSDEPFHFSRGQAYLHFFLTGKKDYGDTPPYPRLRSIKAPPGAVLNSPPFPDDSSDFVSSRYTYEQAIDDKYKNEGRSLWRSFFQNDNLNFNSVITIEDGHPPLGGIIASATNYIFYQRLHILGDIESYHIAEILISFLGLAALSYFTYKIFGHITSFIAAATVAFYPLFFSESHFNIKDPLETSLLGVTIILFYLGVVNRRWKLILLSAIFSGLALGVKFNAVFLPFIIGPWFVYYIFTIIRNKKKKQSRDGYILVGSLLVYPLLAIFVFYILWPFLWPDPITNIQNTIKFYKSIGTGSSVDLKNYMIGGFDLFAIYWFLITTVPAALAAFLIGVFRSFYVFIKTKNPLYVLLFCWLLVPFVRVLLPNTAIYGGIRQILEFIFPFGIFAGIGVVFLSQKFFVNKILQAAVFLFYIILILLPIIKYHPNENVYFNELVGNLSGAKANNVPFWGNSYGNVYLQGINWLNQNAENGASVGLPVATMANIPKLKLRSDIKFNNAVWSGPNRSGEYEIEQIYDYAQLQWYSFQYYDVYLNPVYEVVVDGTTLLKIWKNDLAHTKKGYEKEISLPFIKQNSQNNELVFDMGSSQSITRIIIDHSTHGCSDQKGGFIALSQDGVNWAHESEAIDYPQVPPDAVGWDKDTFVFLFAAKKARYILLSTGMSDSCILESPRITIKGLPNSQ